ncbi:MAG TPA: CHAD domain-containing protein [Anaerolineales bacterium]|nr:CHAD domain-containing protein [Anaerolineales bacterium]HNB35726.1 CHAD domain-containing protein [Anaerolineales bacterium]
MNEAKQLLLDALETRWKKFHSELKTCRAEFSEEAVHDLRVATRRLLALFDLLRSILIHNRIQKIRRTLKEQLDDLDDLRDTQVMLADISEFIQDIPSLRVFQERLQKNEKKLLRQTRKRIQSRDPSKLAARIKKVSAMLADLPEPALREHIFTATDERFARVLQAHNAVDLEHIPSIHKLRIAFKKFRYTIEIVNPLIADFPAENFERMHSYQSMMGDIQDLEVASQNFAELTNASHPDLEPASIHYASRLRTAVFRFVEDKGEAFTFWRNTPDQPFPWEK